MLSCFVLITQAAAAIPQTGRARQRPYSCHLAGTAACTWAGTHCHSSRVTMHHHGGGGGRPAPLAAAPGQICAIAWGFFTQTPAQPSVWRGVESSSHTHASRRNLPPLLPVENMWRGQDGEIKKQNETKETIVPGSSSTTKIFSGFKKQRQFTQKKYL